MRPRPARKFVTQLRRRIQRVPIHITHRAPFLPLNGTIRPHRLLTADWTRTNFCDAVSGRWIGLVADRTDLAAGGAGTGVGGTVYGGGTGNETFAEVVGAVERY